MEGNTNKLPKGAGKSSFELVEPSKLMANLPVEPGSIIMDIACGKGAYSIFLSKIVGENGLIYAVDLWKEGLMLLDEQIHQKCITNIMPLHADATLANEIDIDDYSLDLCLMATVLHDFEEAGQTEPVLKLVKNLLKPNGYLAVVEFKKIGGPPGPPVKIRLSPAEVDTIVPGYGFRHIKTGDIGDYNYLMMFKSEW